MTTRLPSAALLDMDGTLIDSESLWLIAETAVMADHGYAWTQADQAHCLGGPLERVADYMSQRATSGVSATEIGHDLLARMEALLRSTSLRWMPGARDLLVDLHAHRVPAALVSASWRSLVAAVHEAAIEDLGFDPFAATVAGDEVAASKPDPAPYLLAAERLNVVIADAVAIEDSPVGVASASASGAVVVAVPHLAAVADGDGVVVVDSLEGIGARTLGGLVAGRLAAEALNP